ncbi:hypothetical protein H696_00006 [Fonticula alba]|uniref:BAH domain-containing protein n=1 Tax=Fonticula alba TaxID=691883 RepID=A0A058ZEP8_FONAL|nr:hypothetical protein H696_00006 [Fonticula alba]KCV72421.1 hypothetical protein H696_00006 [Fonticula alba]|eukprot:XP_009492122.1 hypothetical protein H696_00006 [Fonticula alba]
MSGLTSTKRAAKAKSAAASTSTGASKPASGRVRYRAFSLRDHRYSVGCAVRILSREGLDYLARVKKIEGNPGDSVDVMITVRWFYRPEEIKNGRRAYHGKNEVLLTDHEDTIHVGAVNGPAIILPFKEWLDRQQQSDPEDGPQDVDEEHVFYYREKYEHITGDILTKLEQYCRCECPENPDRLMIYCDTCEKWFHAECEQLTDEDLKAAHYSCAGCRAALNTEVAVAPGAPTLASAKGGPEVSPVKRETSRSRASRG